MGSAHAAVSLPRTGRGSHPDNGSVALDGRLRNLMCGPGVVDKDQHTGSLYWLVQRTSKAPSANLSEEMTSWEQSVSVTLPGPARKKARTLFSEWSCTELLGIPILVNKRDIPKHTRLTVFLADKTSTKLAKKD